MEFSVSIYSCICYLTMVLGFVYLERVRKEKDCRCLFEKFIRIISKTFCAITEVPKKTQGIYHLCLVETVVCNN